MRPELEKAVKLLRKEDADSVQEALRLLQGTVFSFSMKLCGHREDAEDTMQEVLANSLRHLAKIEDPRALSVWLYTAARNRCWRSRKKDANRRTISLDDLMPGEVELNTLLATCSASPEQQVLRDEDSRLVHEAVLRLPPQYRIVLVLHDIEELDTGQTAQVLSLQPGTVRVRLHRARLLLRKEMDAMFHPLPKESRRQRTSTEMRPRECQKIFGNLSEYLDGRIQVKSCEQMRTHIEACPQCVAFIRDLKLAIDRSRSLEIPSDGDTGSSLRRLLAGEYLRLIETRASEISATKPF